MTHQKEIEIPLIFNDPQVTKELQNWRDLIDQIQKSQHSHEIAEIKAGAGGVLVCVLKPKSGKK